MSIGKEKVCNLIATDGFLLNIIDHMDVYSIPAILVLLSLSIFIMVLYLERKYIIVNNNSNYKEKVYNLLSDNIDEVFLIYNTITEKQEFISPNFEKVFGFRRSTLTKNPEKFLDYVDQEYREKMRDRLSFNSLRDYQEAEFLYHQPITEKKIWFLVKIYPVYKDHKVTKIIINTIDRTNEYEIRQSVREALSEVQRANEAKKEFMSHISHELKTPINAILGLTQIASNSINDTDKILNCLDKINYSSRNLLLLIDNILDTAKLDNDRLTLKQEPFYLSNTLFAFSSLIHAQAEMKHQNYRFIFHKFQHDYLIGDSLRLTQILGNCLYNSVKFTPVGGSITLEVLELKEAAGKSIYRFIITDTGKGMHQEFLDHLFEAFEQEDESISIKYGGSGLGMSIVKNLLSLMEGKIQVESQPGQGTRMMIDIGFERMAKSDGKKGSDIIYENPPVESKRNTRILVVEDNEINLEIMSEFLKQLELEHDVAMSSKEALKLFETSPEDYYDIILMDVQLPDADGFETTKMIRSLPRPDAGKVYILAISADNLVNDLSYTDCGMNGHLTKPVAIGELKAVIENIRNRKDA